MNTEAVTGNELPHEVPVNVDERCLQPYPVVEKRQGQTPLIASSNECSMLSRADGYPAVGEEAPSQAKSRVYYQK